MPEFVRARVLVLREQAFVSAARGVGATRPRIMVQHILRGVRGELIVYFGIDFAGALLGVASFSFLGLGVRPPTPEWGSMLSAAEPYQVRDPWLVIIPGLAVGIVALSSYMLADRARDVVDPSIQTELIASSVGRPGAQPPRPEPRARPAETATVPVSNPSCRQTQRSNRS